MSLRLPAMVISATGSADHAVADDEARGAAAIIAGHAVDALPDQLGDEQAELDVGDQILGQQRAGRHIEVARPRPRRPADAAHGMAGRREAKLAGRSAESSSQPVSTPSATMSVGAVGRPSPSNGLERSPRRRCGSSRIVMPRGEHLRRRADRAGSSSGARSAAPVIAPVRWPSRLDPTRGSIHHRHRPRGELAGVEPRDRAVAGAPADRRRIFEIGEMARAVIAIIALHARRPRRRSRWPSCHSRSSNSRARSRALVPSAKIERLALRRRALAVGDAGDRARRILGRRARARAARPGRDRRRRRRRDRAACRVSSRSAGARPDHGSSGASRAIAIARSTSAASASADRSDEETLAERRPTNRRRPISSPSDRSTSSSAPRRT